MKHPAPSAAAAAAGPDAAFQCTAHTYYPDRPALCGLNERSYEYPDRFMLVMNDLAIHPGKRLENGSAMYGQKMYGQKIESDAIMALGNSVPAPMPMRARWYGKQTANWLSNGNPGTLCQSDPVSSDHGQARSSRSEHHPVFSPIPVKNGSKITSLEGMANHGH